MSDQHTQTDRPTIVSPDTGRTNRVPPGQRETKGWPVLHYGGVPHIVADRHKLRVWGLVDHPLELDFVAFAKLPQVDVLADFHCVTTWSKLDNRWTGVSFKYLCDLAQVRPAATTVIAHGHGGFTANVPLADALQDDVLVATHHNGQPLTPDHGYPMRFIVPRLYAWKSAKWLTGLEFVAEDRPGFWEQAGYHMHGDPWTEERFGGRFY